jgi:hypothetical protein
MESYYRRLIAGEGRSEALRAVQLEMLDETWLRHPYCWASLVPIGRWGALSRPAARSVGSEKAGPGAAGHTYAPNGLWYYALDFVSQRIRERPGEPSLRSRRAELLEQAGLQTAADYDRRGIDAE